MERLPGISIYRITKFIEEYAKKKTQGNVRKA